VGLQSPDDSIRVRVVAGAADFDALESRWAHLHDASGTSAFQSFEWQRAWWRHFGEPNARLKLHVLELQENGRTIAVAPFVIEKTRSFALVSLRRLVLLGRGESDYLDLLILPGCAERVCRAIARHVQASAPCDVVAFVDVPDASPILTLLMKDLAALGWQASSEVREQCPRTQLLESWPATLASFEDGHRKRVAYLDRKLRKNFKVEVRRVEQGTDPAPALAEFIAMHRRRWASVGESGAFPNRRAEQFHEEVARRFQQRGWLVLAFLMLNDRAAAVIYAFKTDGRLQFYLSGTGDYEEARRFAPGILLHSYCMAAMIDEGVRIYDFLRGTERYKYELGAKNVPNWSVLLLRRRALVGLRQSLYTLRQTLGTRLKARLKRAPASEAA
jgi:CelD/BcsL family acetyltransferase involved in cellulose biosynthesis